MAIYPNSHGKLCKPEGNTKSGDQWWPWCTSAGTLKHRNSESLKCGTSERKTLKVATLNCSICCSTLFWPNLIVSSRTLASGAPDVEGREGRLVQEHEVPAPCGAWLPRRCGKIRIRRRPVRPFSALGRVVRASRDKGPRYTPWSSQLRSAAANAWRRSDQKHVNMSPLTELIQSHAIAHKPQCASTKNIQCFSIPADGHKISWSLCPLPLQPLVASWSIWAVCRFWLRTRSELPGISCLARGAVPASKWIHSWCILMFHNKHVQDQGPLKKMLRTLTKWCTVTRFESTRKCSDQMTWSL